MGRLCGVSAVAFLCVLSVATTTSAQSIGGTVTDTTGGVLPGATIAVRSPALIEQVRTAVSDGAGQYLIILLEPGIYSVTFTLPGFSTFLREGIELIGEATANVDGQLAVGNIQETITVSGASPLVDVQNVAQSAIMTREIVDTVPSGKYFNHLAVLVPGMTVGTTYGISQDVGGQAGQAQSRLSMHGGRQQDQRIFVDGMSVATWTQEDGSAVWLTDGNFEEVQIDHTAASAEAELGGVRFNMIPRSGSNTFSSRSFFNYTHPNLQSENATQELIDKGLPTFVDLDGSTVPASNKVKNLWSVNPSIGGPIVRDKLWFFGSYTRQVADNYIAFFDSVDPNADTYVPSTTQSLDDQDVHDFAARITWQVNPTNKIQFYLNDNTVCHCHFLIGTAIGTNVMSGASVFQEVDNQVLQASWTSSLSSRLLLEGAVSATPSSHPFVSQPGIDAELPGIIEALGEGGLTRAIRGMASWYPPGRKNWLIDDNTIAARGALSYVTGSHSFKVGTRVDYGVSDRTQDGHTNNSQIIKLGSGAAALGLPVGPVSATFNTYPLNAQEHWEHNYVWIIGVYAQDQWTMDRMTVNAGLRFDYWRGGYPDGDIPLATWRDAVTFPGADPVVWKDLSPRLGLVYDLFNDGKTALKVTANKYVIGHGTTLVGNLVNPALLNSSSARTWLDGAFGICVPPIPCIPGDGIAQGDPRIEGPNGELLSKTSNTEFGTLKPTTKFKPDWAKGWGVRDANWEFSAGVQHELVDGLSVNVGWFRRVFTNFAATNNALINAVDYDEFCVTVPTDSRLPNSGEQRCGYFNQQTASVGRVDNLRQSADNIGEQTQHWNGVDLTANARMDNGLVLQGGLSTGRTSQNNCDLIANLNSPAGSNTVSNVDCDRQQGFQTQVKFLASYTLPYDIQIAGTLQSIPGLPLHAHVTYAAAQTTLGLLGLTTFTSGQDTRTLEVLDRDSEYTDRLLQVDLRFTKILNVATGRFRAMLDFYNIFNDSTVLRQNSSYGAATGIGTGWLRPQALIPGRLAKIAFQIDF